MTRKVRDEAAAQPMVMLVSALVFAAAVALLVSVAQDEADVATEHVPTIRAPDVATILVDGRGITSADTPWRCEDASPSLKRFGLATAWPGKDGVDPCKVHQLQRANLTHDDVRDLLGLPEDRGIHIRFQPVLDGLATVQRRGGIDLDVAYVAADADPGVAAQELAALEKVVRPPVRVYNDTAWTGMGTCAHDLCFDAEAKAFEVLVVGTDTDHAALEDIIGSRLASWIWDGGTLIVLPSVFADDGWLMGVWTDGHTLGKTPNNLPLREPDEGHPSLHVPNALAWRDYTTQDTLMTTVWPTAPQDAFLPLGDPADPIAHIDRQWVWNEGRVFLVHVPVTAPDGGPYLEGQKILHNLLMRHHKHLWLDFGDTAPDHAGTTTAVRWSQIEHPDPYTGNPGTIGLRVHVHLFQVPT